MELREHVWIISKSTTAYFDTKKDWIFLEFGKNTYSEEVGVILIVYPELTSVQLPAAS